MNNVKSITVKANANFALLKYWGKHDSYKNIPEMPSISLTVSDLTSTVTIGAHSKEREYYLNEKKIDKSTNDKWQKVITQFSNVSSVNKNIFINADNNFLTASGLASSASGIAALTGALNKYFKTDFDHQDLSRIARIGSASAARSIYGGFVELRNQKSGDYIDSYAKQIASVNHWPLSVLVCLTSHRKKKISSTDGMMKSKETSIIYDDWVDLSNKIIDEGRQAILNRDFLKLAELSELSCLFMHAVMMTTIPSLVYWNKKTIECIECIKELRGLGVPIFYTVDAGPHVKAICEPAYSDIALSALSSVIGDENILMSSVGEGLIYKQ